MHIGLLHMAPLPVVMLDAAADTVQTVTGINEREGIAMFDFLFPRIGFPFGFPIPGQDRANFNTLPVVDVQVNSDNVTLELPNGAYRNRPYVGGFYINLRTAIPTGTSGTLPVLIGTNGDTRPLVTYNGAAVTVADLAGTGIYLIHYNKYTNELFLVSGGFKESATTPSTTTNA